MIAGIEIPSQDASVQALAERMVQEAFQMYEDLVPGTMDPVGVFGIAVVKRQVFPAPARPDPRQSYLLDNSQIYESTTPNHSVAIEVIVTRAQPG